MGLRRGRRVALAVMVMVAAVSSMTGLVVLSMTGLVVSMRLQPALCTTPRGAQCIGGEVEHMGIKHVTFVQKFLAAVAHTVSVTGQTVEALSIKLPERVAFVSRLRKGGE